MKYIQPVLLIVLAILALGCATKTPPRTVPQVDLPRFMGAWYVQGGIFTPFEKDVYNGVETYELDDKGRIQTTYTYNQGSLDGKEKTFTSVAFVHNKDTFAEWRIQFFWPLRFPYLVLDLAPDYSTTAVGTDDYKYLWIMSRDPHLPETKYQAIATAMGELGFDTSKFVRVQHTPGVDKSR